MRISIRSIAASDFLSLALGTILSGMDRPGVVFVRGENADAPGSGSNGAGKSALADALLWCLYGETFRGIKGDDLVRRGSRAAEVIVELTGGEGTIRIMRRKELGKPMALSIESDRGAVIGDARLRDAQAQIVRLLGGREAFVASTFFGQGISRFARLPDRERKRLIEQILGFEALEQALGIIRARIAPKRAEMEIGKRLLEADLERAVALGEELSRLEDERKAWIEDAERRGTARAEEKARIDRELAGIPKADPTEALKKAQADLAQIDRRRLAIQEKAAARPEGLRQLEEIDRQLQALEQPGSPCPLCGQEIGAADRDSIRRRLLAELDGIDAEARRVEAEALRAAGDLARVLAAHRRCSEEVAKLLQAHGGFAADQLRARDFRARLAALEEEAKQDSHPPQDPSLARGRGQEAALQSTIAARRERMAVLGRDLRLLEFWEKGFGLRGLRSLILDRILPRLEERANEYAQILAGGTVRIRFSALSSTKAGEDRDILGIDVDNSAGAGIYLGDSAGERARIDLAIALGLFDLARERTGGAGIVFFDEAFESLDEAGCEAVAALLKAHAARWGRIYVISHLDSLAQAFPEQIVIRKRGGVSILDPGRSAPDPIPAGARARSEEGPKPGPRAQARAAAPSAKARAGR